MSGRSTRSLLSTSIRRSPRGANSFRQALISELLPVPRAPVSSTLLAPLPATNCSVLRSSRSFCGSTSTSAVEADRRDVAHRLEPAGAAALAVAKGDRRVPVGRRRADAAARPRAGASSASARAISCDAAERWRSPCGAQAAQRSTAVARRRGCAAPRPCRRRSRRRDRSRAARIGCMPVKAPNAGSTPTSSPNQKHGRRRWSKRAPAEARRRDAGGRRARRRRAAAAGGGRARSRRASTARRRRACRDATADRRRGRRGCRARASSSSAACARRQRATAPSVAGACACAE